MEDYTNLLEKMKSKKQYFENIDFKIIASDYDEMITAIEKLIEELQRKEEVIANGSASEESV